LKGNGIMIDCPTAMPNDGLHKDLDEQGTANADNHVCQYCALENVIWDNQNGRSLGQNWDENHISKTDWTNDWYLHEWHLYGCIPNVHISHT
jgi:hypothetical protein